MLRKLFKLLDGTVTSRGQSVVELALVTPFLIILLAGLAEIGWFANTYLTLLEVTRVGARTATTQQYETSPLYWEDPNNELLGASLVPAQSSILYNTWLFKYRNCKADDFNAKIGFYNFIGCIMLQSMNPLRISSFEPNTVDPETNKVYTDDIVISAFAVQAIDPSSIPNFIRDKIEWPLKDALDQSQDIVVGRYPSNVNECTSLFTRDPFDYVVDQNFSSFNWNNHLYPLELPGYDSNSNENQLGFVWNGQHINKWGCSGSDFSTQDVERLINLQKFGLKANDLTTIYQNQRDYITSQGIVLVELHWKHTTLSQFIGFSPVVSPVFSIFGVSEVISVWAIFPLPQVEPHIDLPPKGSF